MKRKDYQTPAMKVVKLRHRGFLLTSDPPQSAKMKDYEVKGEQTW